MWGSTGMIESGASATKAVVIPELSAMGEVRVIAVNQAMPVPIRSPVVPPPAEAAEETDTNSNTEADPRPVEEEARNANPIRIERERITVDDPRIVLRHIHDLRICRFNDDRISLGRHGFLRRTPQVPGLLSSLAHHLHRVEHVPLPLHVRLPERSGHGPIFPHHAKQPVN